MDKSNDGTEKPKNSKRITTSRNHGVTEVLPTLPMFSIVDPRVFWTFTPDLPKCYQLLRYNAGV